jgi:hypothetical protein
MVSCGRTDRKLLSLMIRSYTGENPISSDPLGNHVKNQRMTGAVLCKTGQHSARASQNGNKSKVGASSEAFLPQSRTLPHPGHARSGS